MTQDVDVAALYSTGRLNPPHVEGRLATITLDSKSWVELWDDPAGYRAEYHLPRREASVGYVDYPIVAAGPDARRTVAQVLADTTHDPRSAIARLEEHGAL